MKWLYVGSGIPGLDFTTLAFARSLWSLPFLAVLAFVRRPAVLRSQDWSQFVGLAVVNAGMNVMFPYAAQHTSAAHLTLIYGATAPIVAVFESIFRRVSLDSQRKLAAGFGVAGVAVVALTKSTSGASLFGDAVLAVWLLGFGAQAVLTRILCEHYSAGFVTGLSWGMSAALICAVGFSLGLLARLPLATATPEAAFTFLGILVIGMTFLAPTAFARAAKSTTAAIATGATYYLAMFVGLILSVTVVHEQLRAGAIAGALLLFIAIGLMMIPRSAWRAA